MDFILGTKGSLVFKAEKGHESHLILVLARKTDWNRLQQVVLAEAQASTAVAGPRLRGAEIKWTVGRKLWIVYPVDHADDWCEWLWEGEK